MQNQVNLKIALETIEKPIDRILVEFKGDILDEKKEYINRGLSVSDQSSIQELIHFLSQNLNPDEGVTVTSGNFKLIAVMEK